MAAPFGSGSQQQPSPFSSPTSVPQSQLRASGPAVTIPPTAPQPASFAGVVNVSPTKPVTTVSMCRSGQEIIQEILNKTTEIFQYLRTMQVWCRWTVMMLLKCGIRKRQGYGWSHHRHYRSPVPPTPRRGSIFFSIICELIYLTNSWWIVVRNCIQY